MAEFETPPPVMGSRPAPALGRAEPLTVRIGFIPLLDAAILFAAEEMGFARAEGLTLDLVKDVSWSNIRDRLAFRQFDAAHLLGPMAVASQIGIGSNPFPVIAPMALGRGGNAITLSRALVERMDAQAGAVEGEGALAEARRLALVVRERAAHGEKPLVFGVVYPFSSHNYEFRFWLACGGIDPDRDVTMTVVPPPMTADALAAGAIDGFCVNAPWNVLAVEAGIGRIVAVKADIWPFSPEKVLGLRPDWAAANADTVSRLIRSLVRAARWCDAPENRDALAAILAEPRYVGGRVEMIRSILSGALPVDGARSRQIDGYLAFHRGDATVPCRSHALWVYSQMVRWGQASFSQEGAASAGSAFRPDLYRHALGEAALAASGGHAEGTGAGVVSGEMFLDGRPFDPNRIEDYARGFSMRTGGQAPTPPHPQD